MTMRQKTRFLCAVVAVGLWLTGCSEPAPTSNSDTWTLDGHADALADGLDDAQPDETGPTPDSTSPADTGETDADTDLDATPETDGSTDRPGLVETTEGPVRGEEVGDVGAIWQFLGIPYAKPPTGDLRWRAPREPAERSEVLEADNFMPACPQPERPTNPGDPGPTSEDCLGLNVWTPSPDPDAKAPVMVWIHGGGFLEGSSRVNYPGQTFLYAGRKLAQRGVVVVTLNYRLGPLGFFAHPDLIGDDSEYDAAGNYGFLDQIAALEWVQRNIEQFGGDPDQVTLFGESAGGISACGHLVSPKSQGLFDRVIMQSGSCPLQIRWLDEKKRGLESAVTQGERIAEKLDCGDGGLSCLRDVPAETFFEKMETTYAPGADGEAFGPIVDGDVFPKPIWKLVEAGEAASVPLLAGTTADEGTIWASRYKNYSTDQYETWVEETFPDRAEGVLAQYPASDYGAPWKAIAAILGDTAFKCSTRWTTRLHVADGHTAFHYLFSHVTPYGERNDLGAFHGSELTFVFGNFIRPNVPMHEFGLSQKMMAAWTAFAKTGNPGSTDALDWEPYSLIADQTRDFQTGGLGTRTGYRKDACEFWAGQ